MIFFLEGPRLRETGQARVPQHLFWRSECLFRALEHLLEFGEHDLMPILSLASAEVWLLVRSRGGYSLDEGCNAVQERAKGLGQIRLVAKPWCWEIGFRHISLIFIFYTINAAHRQYSLSDTIFNYIFYLGPPGTPPNLSAQNTLHVGRRNQPKSNDFCVWMFSLRSKINGIVKHCI